MKEREKTAWIHGVRVVLVMALLGGVVAYCDSVVHEKGEEVRYVGSRVVVSGDGCELFPGELGIVTKSGSMNIDGESKSASWVKLGKCEFVVESGQLVE